MLRKAYLDHPSICISAIGDYQYDNVPMQIGQFESGIEIDDDITKLYLEGGGGGNDHESYEMALYFLARMVDADEFEKRNGKGYAFIICDESLHGVVSKAGVKSVFGVTEQADIPIETIMEEVLAKWELFVIVPNMTAHFKNDRYKTRWKQFLKQRLILLDDPNEIVNTIAATIGMTEGVDLDDITKDIKDVADSVIIITSSWKYNIDDIDKMRAMFKSQGVIAHIHELLPNLEPSWPDQSRGEEVRQYVKRNKLSKYFILDDTNHEWFRLSPKWIRTDPYVGLEEKHIEEAIGCMNYEL